MAPENVKDRRMSAPSCSSSPVYAVLLTGGKSTRMQGFVEDKIFARLGSMSVFQHSVRAFLAAGGVDGWCVVVDGQRTPHDQVVESMVAVALAGGWVLDPATVVFAEPGPERADSVRSALRRIENPQGYVLIHDCARPLIHPQTIRAVRAAVLRDGAACVARRVTDTIKRAPGVDPQQPRPVVLEDLDRSTLWAMETPQAFRLDWIRRAHAEARGPLTDDTTALSQLGWPVTLVENRYPYPKLT